MVSTVVIKRKVRKPGLLDIITFMLPSLVLLSFIDYYLWYEWLI